MAISMVELQGGINRTTDFGNIRQQEQERPVVEQQDIGIRTEKEAERKQTQVVQKDESAKGDNNADAKDEGKNQYTGDGGKNRAKAITKDGVVIIKEKSGFEVTI